LGGGGGAGSRNKVGPPVLSPSLPALPVGGGFLPVGGGGAGGNFTGPFTGRQAFAPPSGAGRSSVGRSSSLVSGGGGSVVMRDPTQALQNRPAAVDNKTGLPLWGDIALVDRIKCARGYVAVQTFEGESACMLKSAAIALGKWKQRKKPPISVRDWRAFQRSTSVVNKLERIASKAVDFKAKKRVIRK